MTKEINHQERAHAELSASGSSRWLNCPGSVAAVRHYPEKPSSIYALEGTLAHELADTCLTNKEDAEKYIGKKILDQEIEKDMADYVQEYLDYVRSFETKSTFLFCEDQVQFSNIVKDGFGTLDAAIIDYDNDTTHIFDLKYGKGVIVDAEENTQAMLYALGLINELDFLGPVTKNFTIHIVQPRVPNFSSWSIDLVALKQFAKNAKKAADLALTPGAPRIPGEKQCQWCDAKKDCLELKKFTEDLITAEFSDLDEFDMNAKEKSLTDDQRREILKHSKLVAAFMAAVAEGVQERLENGESFEGYKLVEGRSQRKITDEGEVLLVKKVGKRKAYKSVLIGVTEAQKLTDKDFVDSITEKSAGKLTLAPETDKRPAATVIPVVDEFESLEEI